MNNCLVVMWHLLFLTTWAPIFARTFHDEDLRPSLSCILFGDVGCKSKCSILCRTYGCVSWNASCDSVYCDCKEQYAPLVHNPIYDVTDESEELEDFDEVLAIKFKRTPVFDDLEEIDDVLKADIIRFLRDTPGSGQPFKVKFRQAFPTIDHLLYRLRPRPIPKEDHNVSKEVQKQQLGNLTPAPTRWNSFTSWWNKPPVANVVDPANERRLIDMVNGVEKKEDLLNTMQLLKESGDTPLYTAIAKHFLTNGLIMPDGTRILEPNPDPKLVKQSLDNDKIFQAIENAIKEEKEQQAARRRKQPIPQEEQNRHIQNLEPLQQQDEQIGNPEKSKWIPWSFPSFPSWYSSQPVTTGITAQGYQYQEPNAEGHNPLQAYHNSQYEEAGEGGWATNPQEYTQNAQSKPLVDNSGNDWSQKIKNYDQNAEKYSPQPTDKNSYYPSQNPEQSPNDAFSQPTSFDEGTQFSNIEPTKKYTPTKYIEQALFNPIEPEWSNFIWDQSSDELLPSEAEEFFNIPSSTFHSQLDDGNTTNSPPASTDPNLPSNTSSSFLNFFGDLGTPQEAIHQESTPPTTMIPESTPKENKLEPVTVTEQFDFSSADGDESADNRGIHFFFDKQQPPEQQATSTAFPISLFPNEIQSGLEELEEDEINLPLQELLKLENVPNFENLSEDVERDNLNIGTRNFGSDFGDDDWVIPNFPSNLPSEPPAANDPPDIDVSPIFDNDYIVERKHLNRLQGLMLPFSSESEEEVPILITRKKKVNQNETPVISSISSVPNISSVPSLSSVPNISTIPNINLMPSTSPATKPSHKVNTSPATNISNILNENPVPIASHLPSPSIVPNTSPISSTSLVSNISPLTSISPMLSKSSVPNTDYMPSTSPITNISYIPNISPLSSVIPSPSLFNIQFKGLEGSPILQIDGIPFDSPDPEMWDYNENELLKAPAENLFDYSEFSRIPETPIKKLDSSDIPEDLRNFIPQHLVDQLAGDLSDEGQLFFDPSHDNIRQKISSGIPNELSNETEDSDKLGSEKTPKLTVPEDLALSDPSKKKTILTKPKENIMSNEVKPQNKPELNMDAALVTNTPIKSNKQMQQNQRNGKFQEPSNKPAILADKRKSFQNQSVNLTSPSVPHLISNPPNATSKSNSIIDSLKPEMNSNEGNLATDYLQVPPTNEYIKQSSGSPIKGNINNKENEANTDQAANPNKNIKIVPNAAKLQNKSNTNSDTLSILSLPKPSVMIPQNKQIDAFQETNKNPKIPAVKKKSSLNQDINSVPVPIGLPNMILNKEKDQFINNPLAGKLDPEKIINERNSVKNGVEGPSLIKDFQQSSVPIDGSNDDGNIGADDQEERKANPTYTKLEEEIIPNIIKPQKKPAVNIDSLTSTLPLKPSKKMVQNQQIAKFKEPFKKPTIPMEKKKSLQNQTINLPASSLPNTILNEKKNPSNNNPLFNKQGLEKILSEESPIRGSTDIPLSIEDTEESIVPTTSKNENTQIKNNNTPFDHFTEGNTDGLQQDISGLIQKFGAPEGELEFPQAKIPHTAINPSVTAQITHPSNLTEENTGMPEDEFSNLFSDEELDEQPNHFAPKVKKLVETNGNPDTYNPALTSINNISATEFNEELLKNPHLKQPYSLFSIPTLTKPDKGNQVPLITNTPKFDAVIENFDNPWHPDQKKINGGRAEKTVPKFPQTMSQNPSTINLKQMPKDMEMHSFNAGDSNKLLFDEELDFDDFYEPHTEDSRKIKPNRENFNSSSFLGLSGLSEMEDLSIDVLSQEKSEERAPIIKLDNFINLPNLLEKPRHKQNDGSSGISSFLPLKDDVLQLENSIGGSSSQQLTSPDDINKILFGNELDFNNFPVPLNSNDIDDKDESDDKNFNLSSFLKISDADHLEDIFEDNFTQENENIKNLDNKLEDFIKSPIQAINTEVENNENKIPYLSDLFLQNNILEPGLEVGDKRSPHLANNIPNLDNFSKPSKPQDINTEPEDRDFHFNLFSGLEDVNQLDEILANTSNNQMQKNDNPITELDDFSSLKDFPKSSVLITSPKKKADNNNNKIPVLSGSYLQNGDVSQPKVSVGNEYPSYTVINNTNKPSFDNTPDFDDFFKPSKTKNDNAVSMDEEFNFNFLSGMEDVDQLEDLRAGTLNNENIKNKNLANEFDDFSGLQDFPNSPFQSTNPLKKVENNENGASGLLNLLSPNDILQPQLINGDEHFPYTIDNKANNPQFDNVPDFDDFFNPLKTKVDDIEPIGDKANFNLFSELEDLNQLEDLLADISNNETQETDNFINDLDDFSGLLDYPKNLIPGTSPPKIAEDYKNGIPSISNLLSLPDNSLQPKLNFGNEHFPHINNTGESSVDNTPDFDNFFKPSKTKNDNIKIEDEKVYFNLLSGLEDVNQLDGLLADMSNNEILKSNNFMTQFDDFSGLQDLPSSIIPVTNTLENVENDINEVPYFSSSFSQNADDWQPQHNTDTEYLNPINNDIDKPLFRNSLDFADFQTPLTLKSDSTEPTNDNFNLGLLLGINNESHPENLQGNLAENEKHENKGPAIASKLDDFSGLSDLKKSSLPSTNLPKLKKKLKNKTGPLIRPSQNDNIIQPQLDNGREHYDQSFFNNNNNDPKKLFSNETPDFDDFYKPLNNVDNDVKNGNAIKPIDENFDLDSFLGIGGIDYLDDLKGDNFSDEDLVDGNFENKINDSPTTTSQTSGPVQENSTTFPDSFENFVGNNVLFSTPSSAQDTRLPDHATKNSSEAQSKIGQVPQAAPSELSKSKIDGIRQMLELPHNENKLMENLDDNLLKIGTQDLHPLDTNNIVEVSPLIMEVSPPILPEKVMKIAPKPFSKLRNKVPNTVNSSNNNQRPSQSNPVLVESGNKKPIERKFLDNLPQQPNLMEGLSESNYSNIPEPVIIAEQQNGLLPNIKTMADNFSKSSEIPADQAPSIINILPQLVSLSDESFFSVEDVSVAEKPNFDEISENNTQINFAHTPQVEAPLSYLQNSFLSPQPLLSNNDTPLSGNTIILKSSNEELDIHNLADQILSDNLHSDATSLFDDFVRVKNENLPLHSNTHEFIPNNITNDEHSMPKMKNSIEETLPDNLWENVFSDLFAEEQDSWETFKDISPQIKNDIEKNTFYQSEYILPGTEKSNDDILSRNKFPQIDLGENLSEVPKETTIKNGIEYETNFAHPQRILNTAPQTDFIESPINENINDIGYQQMEQYDLNSPTQLLSNDSNSAQSNEPTSILKIPEFVGQPDGNEKNVPNQIFPPDNELPIKSKKARKKPKLRNSNIEQESPRISNNSLTPSDAANNPAVVSYIPQIPETQNISSNIFKPSAKSPLSSTSDLMRPSTGGDIDDVNLIIADLYPSEESAANDNLSALFDTFPTNQSFEYDLPKEVVKENVADISITNSQPSNVLISPEGSIKNDNFWPGILKEGSSSTEFSVSPEITNDMIQTLPKLNNLRENDKSGEILSSQLSNPSYENLIFDSSPIAVQDLSSKAKSNRFSKTPLRPDQFSSPPMFRENNMEKSPAPRKQFGDPIKPVPVNNGEPNLNFSSSKPNLIDTKPQKSEEYLNLDSPNALELATSFTKVPDSLIVKSGYLEPNLNTEVITAPASSIPTNLPQLDNNTDYHLPEKFNGNIPVNQTPFEVTTSESLLRPKPTAFSSNISSVSDDTFQQKSTPKDSITPKIFEIPDEIIDLNLELDGDGNSPTELENTLKEKLLGTDNYLKENSSMVLVNDVPAEKFSLSPNVDEASSALDNTALENLLNDNSALISDLPIIKQLKPARQPKSKPARKKKEDLLSNLQPTIPSFVMKSPLPEEATVLDSLSLQSKPKAPYSNVDSIFENNEGNLNLPNSILSTSAAEREIDTTLSNPERNNELIFENDFEIPQESNFSTFSIKEKIDASVEKSKSLYDLDDDFSAPSSSDQNSQINSHKFGQPAFKNLSDLNNTTLPDSEEDDFLQKMMEDWQKGADTGTNPTFNVLDGNNIQVKVQGNQQPNNPLKNNIADMEKKLGSLQFPISNKENDFKTLESDLKFEPDELNSSEIELVATAGSMTSSPSLQKPIKRAGSLKPKPINPKLKEINPSNNSNSEILGGNLVESTNLVEPLTKVKVASLSPSTEQSTSPQQIVPTTNGRKPKPQTFAKPKPNPKLPSNNVIKTTPPLSPILDNSNPLTNIFGPELDTKKNKAEKLEEEFPLLDTDDLNNLFGLENDLNTGASEMDLKLYKNKSDYLLEPNLTQLQNEDLPNLDFMHNKDSNLQGNQLTAKEKDLIPAEFSAGLPSQIVSNNDIEPALLSHNLWPPTMDTQSLENPSDGFESSIGVDTTHDSFSLLPSQTTDTAPEKNFELTTSPLPLQPISLTDMLKTNNFDAGQELPTTEQLEQLTVLSGNQPTDLPLNPPNEFIIPALSSNSATNSPLSKPIQKPMPKPRPRPIQPQVPTMTSVASNPAITNENNNVPNKPSPASLNLSIANPSPLQNKESSVENAPLSMQPATVANPAQLQTIQKPIRPRPVQLPPLQPKPANMQPATPRRETIGKVPPVRDDMQQKINDIMNSYPAEETDDFPPANLFKGDDLLNLVSSQKPPLKPITANKPENINKKRPPSIMKPPAAAVSQPQIPISSSIRQPQISTKPEIKPKRPPPTVATPKINLNQLPTTTNVFNFDDTSSILGSSVIQPSADIIPSFSTNKQVTQPEFNNFDDLAINFAADDKFSEQELYLANRNPKIRPDILMGSQGLGNANTVNATKPKKPTFGSQ